MILYYILYYVIYYILYYILKHLMAALKYDDVMKITILIFFERSCVIPHSYKVS